MKKSFSLLLAFCSVFLISTQAFANVKTYLVAPFKVNGPSDYQYLERSIPSMVASRLFWSGNYETASTQDSFAKTKPIDSRQTAAKTLDKQKADYLFYGSVTILGNEASVDMTALSKQGQVWQNSTSAKVDNLITELQTLSDTFASQVFKKKASSQARSGEFIGRVPTSGSIIEAEQSSRFVSSSFYYEDQDTTRLRSQTLPIAAVSMDMADIDNDNAAEMVFADAANKIYLYSWMNGKLSAKAEYELPGAVRSLAVRFFEQGGKHYIAYSGFSDHEARPLGTILEFNGSSLVEVADRIPYYLNTVILPGLRKRTLIAQSYDMKKVFRGPVFELYVDGNKSYSKGPNVPSLPSVANVYNFAYLPSSAGDNVAVLDKHEKIAVYAKSGKRLYQTTDTYSGGNAYIRLFGGKLSGNTYDNTSYYYIPMRMLSLDLDKNNKYELLANRPLSTAATVFKNFRNYPQGEIQAFVWDEYTLAMLWKTKKINGTVADIHVGDPNDDGILDLVVTVVSYPGALGTGDKKTYVSLFPLELEEIQNAPGERN